ncbi:hypothetical protein IHE45_20G054200 [Dioscorea alata]|uniref:Uncharacterized protein n=1 Tax=Dioscorea alata TaxID=55571 RepID=A0ACB7TSU8_DIOAL|nr:hypothetical protein IHE45_20G054200 [Dioscorea alata]
MVLFLLFLILIPSPMKAFEFMVVSFEFNLLFVIPCDGGVVLPIKCLINRFLVKSEFLFSYSIHFVLDSDLNYTTENCLICL